MRDRKLWKFIRQKLETSQPVMLLCVVESSGSSPGRSGFKMAVTTDEMCGSIGGGIMEHKFVEMAKDRLSLDETPVIKKQFHRKSEAQNQSGMICSGEQTVLMYKVTETALPVIHRLVSAMDENRSGRLRIVNNAISFVQGDDRDEVYFKMKDETEFEYEELVGYRNHLYIIGGGHCALAFSRLMQPMDFYIRMYENRSVLNTLMENNFVHEKIIVEDYSALKDLIPPGENHFVAVMTFGYRTDDSAVRALAGKEFKYIGVLGSASKMQQMFSEWRTDGLPSEWLDKIHSPAGLEIKSETPEEIAISIAAEIIQVKNGN